MIISNERMNFKDPGESDDTQLSQQLLFDDSQVFDDPQLFDDQLEVWTLIIEKSTVIPPSLMVLFFLFVDVPLEGLTSQPKMLWASSCQGLGFPTKGNPQQR